MKKSIICLGVLLSFVTSFYAQVPKSIDLKESDPYQRRDLSTIGSRIVINPYDFGQSPQTNTAAIYSNGDALPLNAAYLTIQNTYHEKEKRFGREFKNILEIRTVSRTGQMSGAKEYLTEWTPHALLFSAEYANGSQMEGYDFFYDDHTIVRNLKLDKKEHYLLSGSIKGEVRLDDRENVLIVHSGKIGRAHV